MGILQKIAMENKTGRQIGVFSVCTSNQLVIRAALRHAGKRGYPLVLEATSNQCNQFGGYTGMTPKDYMDMVHHLVEEEGCPASQLILGGDHLGPLVSCHKPEREAMKDAADMIRAYAAAGFGKIHIDTSMRLGDDDPRQPLAPEVCARRAAELALVVRETCRALPDAEQPVLVVGSEVPIPGGSLVHEDSVTPTSPVEIARQIAAFREAFAQKGLPFGQVIGFVAQPGVEFGDDFVNAYAPRRAAGLMAQMRGCPDLVLEGHSTDYQTRESLSSLVRDGVAILKVGPALTFALREALMLAQQAAGRMGVNVDFTGALENAMLADDRYWKSYYSGTEREVAYKRLFSFSDRCRYYLPDPGVEQAVQTMLTQCGDLPPALLSLYFPRQYTKYRNGQLGSDLRAVILDRIGDVLDDYAAACFPALYE